MPVLHDAGVFYVDSRTTVATVAYDTARRDGVKTAFRNVPFLDDVQTKTAVKDPSNGGSPFPGNDSGSWFPHPVPPDRSKMGVHEGRNP